MISSYLNQTGYRVTKSDWYIYNALSAATLSLVDNAPSVSFRLRITLSTTTGHTDCAGTVTVNSETLTFSQASVKQTTTNLSGLPTIMTANLDCWILIECLSTGGAILQDESQTELDCRFQDTQKRFVDAEGAWSMSQAIAYTDDADCDIGTVFSYDNYDYDISQVSAWAGLDGTEEGRKLWLTGKTAAPTDRQVAVSEDEVTLTRYMTRATYDVDEDGVVDSSRITIVSKTAGATITQYDVVALASDGQVVPAKADSSDTVPAFGWAQSAAVEGGSVNVAIAGETSVRPDVDLTVDGHVFLSDATAGKVTQTAPSTGGTYIQHLGIASSASTIIIDKRPEIYRRP